MNSKIAHRLATNPKAHMDLVSKGKMPKMREPSKSPLWLLLNSLGSSELGKIQGIRLGPELGYESSMVFGNGHQLFRWLGGRQSLGDWENLPAESMEIRAFHKKLTLEDLKKHCAKGPW